MTMQFYSHPVHGKCFILLRELPGEQVLIRKLSTNACVVVRENELSTWDVPTFEKCINKLRYWMNQK